MIKLKSLISEEEAPKCPISTQNKDINMKHRKVALEHGYGPLNTNNPNINFWKERAEEWELEFYEQAKERRCHNCAFFKNGPKITNCITSGFTSALDKGDEEIKEATYSDSPESDDWDILEAGAPGYCTAYKFVSYSSRTCSSWQSKKEE